MSQLNVENLVTTVGVNFPAFNNSTKPASPEIGWVIWNTDINKLERYNGSSWETIGGSQSINASGGNTITYADGYKIHTFTGDGTFSVSSAYSGATAEVLIVAGGGGGGARGGGGGGGGVIYEPAFSLSATSYNVFVGGGGSGRSSTTANSADQDGGNGANSSFANLTAIGGGGGGGFNRNGKAGGSGGGPGRDQDNGGGPGAGTPGQGYRGGYTGELDGQQGCAGGGGGGGANQIGLDGTNTRSGANTSAGNEFGGNGGSGYRSNISGRLLYYGGGGGGGNGCAGVESFRFGQGGKGGGGLGNDSGRRPSTAGQAFTGGGGGAGGDSPQTSANGGSGIVIVRYRV